MNLRQQHVIRSVGGLLPVASVALFVACGGGGGGGGASGTATVALSGTAATGKALANATININCAQGAVSVGADANGNYRATLGAVMPCVITATSGAPAPPLNAAPAAAPSAVPMAALPTALAVAAWLADTPPTWLNAYCRHEASSARNWSNVFPVPGNAITLGAVPLDDPI